MASTKLDTYMKAFFQSPMKYKPSWHKYSISALSIWQKCIRLNINDEHLSPTYRESFVDTLSLFRLSLSLFFGRHPWNFIKRNIFANIALDIVAI